MNVPRAMSESEHITVADDHLRNPGFLFHNDMWRLSPAYDLNPDYEQDRLSLSVDFNDPGRDLRNALEI